MSFDRDKLIRWLSKQIRDSDESRPLKVIILRHYNAKDDIENWSDFSDPSDNGIAILAASISNAIESDAGGLGGVQQYALYPYFGTNTLPDKRFVCTVVNASPEDEDGTGVTERADAKGLTHQLMRHLEAERKISTAAMMQMFQLQSRVIDRQAQHIEQMEAHRLNGITLYEDLASKKHQRDLDTMKAVNREQRFDEIARNVMPMLPLAIQKLTKGQLPAGENTPNPMMEALMHWMASFSEEQMEGFLSVMNPFQKKLFEQFHKVLYEKSQARENASEERKKAIGGELYSGPVPNPLVNGNGERH